MRSVPVAGIAVLGLLAVMAQGGTPALAKSAPLNRPFIAGTIATTGPLTSIAISPDLNCSVNHVGDSAGEWFADSACGTFIVINGSLYGPSYIPAGSSATIPETAAFTPVSQSATTGLGTPSNPYQIVTVVSAGATGVTLTETDTYVIGNEYYRTDVQIQNPGAAATAILYRAGDCYLQNSDYGYGWIDPAGGIACQAGTASVRGTRIEELKPITPGSRWMEDFFDTMWVAVGSKTQLPNTCKSAGNSCGDYIDNAVALSWNLTLPAAGSLVISNLSLFAPLGVAAVTVTATSDQPSVPPGGGTDGYTITISNTNNGSTSLDSISDTLPGGFTYQVDTTTGLTTGNPSVSGQTLTWTGPFQVPASSSITLHFLVTTSSVKGGYYNSATASNAAYGVNPSGSTAPITVGLTQQAVLPALANNAYGGYTTVLYGKNTGTSSATVFVAYGDASGASVGTGDSATVPVNGGFSFRQDSGHAFATAGAGLGAIWSDQPMAAFVNEFAPGGTSDATSYTGVVVGTGTGPSLSAPTIAKNAYGGYTTGIGLVNLGSVSTDITITYRNGDGTMAATETLAGVAAGAYRGVYTGSNATLPSVFAGSATISSSNSSALAAIVNETGPGGQFSSYDTVPTGSATLLAPTMLRNAYGGYNTGLALVETQGSAGTGTITYTNASGTQTSAPLSIGAHGFLGIYQGSGALAPPADGSYTAKIVFTGGAQVAAIVNEVAPGGTMSTSYNTFATGATTVNLPLLEDAGADALTTSVGIMNTGTASTTVTLSYFNPLTGAAMGTAPTVTLLPGATAAIYQGDPSKGLAPGASAAATVTASGGGSIVVICNEVGTGVFMSYIGQ